MTIKQLEIEFHFHVKLKKKKIILLFPGASAQQHQPHGHPQQGAGGGGHPPPQSYAQFSPYAPVGGSYPAPPGLITNAGHPKFPSIHTGGAISPMAPKGGGAIVPTAKLVDLTGSPPFHQNGNGNGVVKRNGVNHHHHQQHHHHDNDPGSSGSSTSTLTGQRGPIPLTIKQLEIEFHFHVKFLKKSFYFFQVLYL